MASKISGPRSCVCTVRTSYEGDERPVERERQQYSRCPGGVPSRKCQARSSGRHWSNFVSLTWCRHCRTWMGYTGWGEGEKDAPKGGSGVVFICFRRVEGEPADKTHPRASNCAPGFKAVCRTHCHQLEVEYCTIEQNAQRPMGNALTSPCPLLRASGFQLSSRPCKCMAAAI